MGSDNAFGWRADGAAGLRIRANDTRACNCVGPQPGQPVCPCRMPAIKVVDGRYVEVIDHGPATARSSA